MTVLAVNVGSSSLQLTVVEPDGSESFARRLPSAQDEPTVRAAIADLRRRAHPVEAVGHRIVHGGPNVLDHKRIDGTVRAHLASAASLAPLHVPAALRVADVAMESLPDVPHVACVDTAFHADLPAAVQTYALPAEWRRRYGVRRYGFHGLSYAWALHRAADLLGGTAADLQLLMAHLGGGSSVCAVRDGRSVDTSMGFTPLEGLVMGSRAGSVDPGLLLWLQTEHGMPVRKLAESLNRRSGLLGLSGRSNDTRDLVAWAARGDPDAVLALDVFCQRAAEELAAAAVSLTRLDGLVFTGEIGGDQPEVRTDICRRLGLLGVRGDALSEVIDVDTIISPATAAIPVLVVRTGEAQQIAAEVRRVVRARGN